MPPSPRTLPPIRRAAVGFTLIEVCVSILIVVVVMGMAVPSLSGVLAERRLRASYDGLAGLAAEAQRRSVVERKTYLLAWDRDGRVRMFPEELPAKQRRAVVPAPLPDGARYALRSGDAGAGTDAPFGDWAFFPTGNCEPATVTCEAPAGTWEASFNALTVRGTFRTFNPR